MQATEKNGTSVGAGMRTAGEPSMETPQKATPAGSKSTPQHKLDAIERLRRAGYILPDGCVPLNPQPESMQDLPHVLAVGHGQNHYVFKVHQNNCPIESGDGQYTSPAKEDAAYSMHPDSEFKETLYASMMGVLEVTVPHLLYQAPNGKNMVVSRLMPHYTPLHQAAENPDDAASLGYTDGRLDTTRLLKLKFFRAIILSVATARELDLSLSNIGLNCDPRNPDDDQIVRIDFGTGIGRGEAAVSQVHNAAPSDMFTPPRPATGAAKNAGDMQSPFAQGTDSRTRSRTTNVDPRWAKIRELMARVLYTDEEADRIIANNRDYNFLPFPTAWQGNNPAAFTYFQGFAEKINAAIDNDPDFEQAIIEQYLVALYDYVQLTQSRQLLAAIFRATCRSYGNGTTIKPTSITEDAFIAQQQAIGAQIAKKLGQEAVAFNFFTPEKAKTLRYAFERKIAYWRAMLSGLATTDPNTQPAFQTLCETLETPVNQLFPTIIPQCQQPKLIAQYIAFGLLINSGGLLLLNSFVGFVFNDIQDTSFDDFQFFGGAAIAIASIVRMIYLCCTRGKCLPSSCCDDSKPQERPPLLQPLLSKETPGINGETTDTRRALVFGDGADGATAVVPPGQDTADLESGVGAAAVATK